MGGAPSAERDSLSSDLERGDHSEDETGDNEDETKREGGGGEEEVEEEQAERGQQEEKEEEKAEKEEKAEQPEFEFSLVGAVVHHGTQRGKSVVIGDRLPNTRIQVLHVRFDIVCMQHA